MNQKPIFLLEMVGFNGPFIVAVITLVSIWKQTKFLLAYLVGFILNIMLNHGLKGWICQSRPKSSIDHSFFDNIANYNGIEIYGMPSGHSQMIFFSLIYLYLVKKSNFLLMTTLFLAGITLYQRWFYGRHTIEQLLVGSFIGTLFAFVWFNFVVNVGF
jgi:dolichyldiphosphatase